MALTHKFDSRQWNRKQQKRDEIRINPGNENSVPQLRQRVERLEQAVGFREVPDTPE